VERVRFLGHIPDSHRYLRAFDIYCLPSYQETFSLALLDAQLAGLPVVGSRSGGTPELVIEGETGWLFLPRDAKSLESASLKATGAIDRWEAMGDSASQRVEKEFGQEVIFQKILELYEQS
jgi:glycosyltransferase involved in cell wall biosynthesis